MAYMYEHIHTVGYMYRSENNFVALLSVSTLGIQELNPYLMSLAFHVSTLFTEPFDSPTPFLIFKYFYLKKFYIIYLIIPLLPTPPRTFHLPTHPTLVLFLKKKKKSSQRTQQ